MTESKVSSVFDFGKQTPKYWIECDKKVLDMQQLIMEQEFLTSGKAQVKPIFLVLGREYIYKVTVNKLKCAPLATMHLSFIDSGADHFVQLNSDDRLYGFRMSYKTKAIDIFLADKKIYDQWKQQLRSCCLLEGFHDEFLVSKMIGKGSFAKVYIGTRKDNNKQFAIKAFSKTFMQTQFKGIESLINEMKIMRQFDHPNILKLYEVHETTNSVYFILDIVAGGELLAKVREIGIIPPKSLQHLAFNFLSALHQLHIKNCAHRDLKPENLLLRSQDNCYDIVLADFGLACIVNDNSTLLFKRCGTPGFVAPEILDYCDEMPLYNQKCDIFSAGIILYVLITGRQPFTGKDQKAILKSNKDCIIDFQDQLYVESPILLQDIVKLMLIRDNIKRPSAEECLNHAYFKELLKDQQHKAQFNLHSYENEFQNGLKQGNLESQGSLTLHWRPPNQQVGQSIDSMSECSVNRLDMRASSSVGGGVGVSKFHQYSQRIVHMGSRDVSDIPHKQESKKNIDLHKIALQNSHKQRVNDQFEDQPVVQEKSDVSEMMREYNSNRQIRIPIQLSHKAQTPTNRKK